MDRRNILDVLKKNELQSIAAGDDNNSEPLVVVNNNDEISKMPVTAAATVTNSGNNELSKIYKPVAISVVESRYQEASPSSSAIAIVSSEPAHLSKLSSINNSLQHETSEWDTWDPMSDDYYSAQNTLALNPENDPLSVVTGQVGQPDSKLGNLTICERYAKYGECADGEYCSRLHVQPHTRERIRALQKTYETNKNRICLNFIDLAKSEIEPNPDVLLLVSVTEAKSPQNFHCVAPYESMNFLNLTYDDILFYVQRVTKTSTVRAKLQKCHEQLASLFDHPYRVDNISDDIYPGQIVACKLKDGRFRRAMVIKKPLTEDELCYNLFLIDVGVEVELPRELIYDIKAQCLSEPPIALDCRLDVVPSKKEAAEFFEQKVRGQSKETCYALCKVIDYDRLGGQYIVDLYQLQTRCSITDLMVREALAERSGYTYN